MRSITLWRFKEIVNREDCGALDFALPNSLEEERISTHIRSQLLSMGVDAPAAETDVFGLYSGPFGRYTLEEREQSRMALTELLIGVGAEDEIELDSDEFYCDSFASLLLKYQSDPNSRFHLYVRWIFEMNGVSSLGEERNAVTTLDLSGLMTDWEVDCECFKAFPNVVRLNLCSMNVHDEHLHALQSLKQLRELDLGYTQITDAGLKHLASLKALRSITLTGTLVSQAGVQWLRENLPKCEVTMY